MYIILLVYTCIDHLPFDTVRISQKFSLIKKSIDKYTNLEVSF